MVAIEQRSIGLPAILESEFSRNKRIAREAEARQNAFLSRKAQVYRNQGPKELKGWWENFLLKPISPCTFSKEDLSRFRYEGFLPLFVSAGAFAEFGVKKAVNGYKIVDKGPLGWIAVQAVIDPPNSGLSRLEMQRKIDEANKNKDRREDVVGLGFSGYLQLAQLIETLTNFRIDSVDGDGSFLLPVDIGGFSPPLVGFDKSGKLKVSLGLADSYREINKGWRTALVSRNLIKG